MIQSENIGKMKSNCVSYAEIVGFAYISHIRYCKQNGALPEQ